MEDMEYIFKVRSPPWHLPVWRVCTVCVLYHCVYVASSVPFSICYFKVKIILGCNGYSLFKERLGLWFVVKEERPTSWNNEHVFLSLCTSRSLSL